MRKFFRQLHKWLSIPAGLIIFVVSFTGTILVFQDEIQEMAHPQRYFNNTKGQQPLALDILIPKVNEQLKNQTVKDVRIYSDTQRNYAMSLNGGDRQTAYVNPYTAEITEIFSTNSSPFYIIMSIHRWLLDGTRTWGKYAVGIATLMFIFILLTGFFVWMPKKWKKNRFVIETQKGKKRLFYDLHSVLGVYAFLILLVCAATGPMWSFQWYRNGVYRILGAETPMAGSHEKNKPEPKGAKGGNTNGKKAMNEHENKKPDFSKWQIVASELQKQNPANDYIVIQTGSASVHQKNAATSRALDKYQFDATSGAITQTQLYADQSYTSKIPGWYRDLHVGAYWGIWSKILTFLAGLIGSSLPITGYYLWLSKKKKKRKAATA